MNRKELSEAIAEAAARTERAAAISQEAKAEQQAAVARQEVATARWEETQADVAERNKKLDAMIEEMRADRARREGEWEEEKLWREQFLRRQEKMIQDFLHRADDVIIEIREQREDLRAMKEAILKLLDRFPPPPPHLRSA